MEFKIESAAADLLRTLNQQRQENVFCDVTLKINSEMLPAHRCILAAASEYFREIFRNNFDSRCAEEHEMPQAANEAMKLAIQYIYTGQIHISIHNVDDILKAADILGMKDIKGFCSDLLRRHLDITNCIHIKMLTDKFELGDIRGDVVDFLVPRMPGLFRGSEILDLPDKYILPLVNDPELNYIQENELVSFVIRWMTYTADRNQCCKDLVPFINFSYLTPDFVRSNISRCQPIMDALSPDQRKVVHTKLSDESFPTKLEHVIFCSTRPINTSEEVNLLVYRIDDDRWYKVENNPYHDMFDGVQSMTAHKDALYILKTRDTYTTESNSIDNCREIWKLDFQQGDWTRMPLPSHLTGQSRMMSHGRAIYVIDNTGVLEKFDNTTNAWINYSGPSFHESQNTTHYILPMPADRYIYLLRVFSRDAESCRQSFCHQVHRYDTNKYCWNALYRIDPTEHGISEQERFSGYSATSMSLTLKNALGLPRITYDLMKGRCSAPQTTPKVPPKLANCILGSTEHENRVYFCGGSNKNLPKFMFYDHSSHRLKSVAPPPQSLSGLSCHAVVPRALRQALANPKS